MREMLRKVWQYSGLGDKSTSRFHFHSEIPMPIRLAKKVEKACLAHAVAAMVVILLMVAGRGIIVKAEVIYVGPEEAFTSIQPAINAALNNDVVIVKAGTYADANNKNLDFGGKDIELRSESGPGNTFIDCGSSGRGLYFHSGETASSIVDGFTIKNANIVGNGGGIYCLNSSPTITNCIIEYNRAEDREFFCIGSLCFNAAPGRGGGIYCKNASVSIINCTIRRNEAIPYGGGIYCAGSDLNIINCNIDRNYTNPYRPEIFDYYIAYGAGIYCDSSTLNLTNCVISENHNYKPLLTMYNVKGRGGGIYYLGSSSSVITNCTIMGNKALAICSYDIIHGIICTYPTPSYPSNPYGGEGHIICCPSSSSVVTITNSILWEDDVKVNFFTNEGSSFNITFSDIPPESPDDFKGGTGTIHTDPEFLGSDSGIYRLSSDSPCIDEGKVIMELYSDQRGSLRPIDGKEDGTTLHKFDMGAFEYSLYYGGAEDSTSKAFKEVEINATYALTGFDYQIQWKNKAPFPKNDTRVMPDPIDISVGDYNVRLALVGKEGRIDLYEGVVTLLEGATTGGYTWSKTVQFNESMVGQWKIRVEMADDPQQFEDSIDPVMIIDANVEQWVIGEEILPPQGADPSKGVEIAEDVKDKFLWSNYSNKLYALGPAMNVILTWKDINNNTLEPVVGSNIWPDTPQVHVAKTPSVDLLPQGCSYQNVKCAFTDVGGTVITESKHFTTADDEGYSVLVYWGGEDEPEDSAQLGFEVVKTVQWNNPNELIETPWDIGEKITDPGHDFACGGGYVFFKNAHYDAQLYERDTEERDGPLIPVNKDNPSIQEDDLVVVWYQKGKFNASWPYKPVRYESKWPDNPDKIIIASELGSGNLPDGYINNQIYVQPDPKLPGYNPNEEHALVIAGPPAKAFALRNDLNRFNTPDNTDTSEPYVLLKYQDLSNDNEWGIRVFKVIAQENPYFFEYTGTAGDFVKPPYPLNQLQACMESHYLSGPWWEDNNGTIWAKKAGSGVLFFYYPLQEDYFYDLDNDGEQDAELGTCIPWLDIYAGTPGRPVAVTYIVDWPEEVPELYIGETLLEAKRKLPDINPQCSVEILFDQSFDEFYKGRSVRLIDPLLEFEAHLEELPSDINVQSKAGKKVFLDLPFHLRTRLSYDPLNKKLKFKGYFDDSQVGEPLLLTNIISDREFKLLENLSGNRQYQNVIQQLYDIPYNQFIRIGKTKLTDDDAESKALTAGAAAGEGYVTLAFGNDPNICTPLTVSLAVIKVTCPLYRGEVKVIEPDNVFDERVTMRHNGDFGGQPEGRTFEWKYSLSIYKPDTPDISPGEWLLFIPDPATGEAAVDITIGGAGLMTLTDKWVTCRYKGYNVCGLHTWSEWTEPQLYEGWIKRVMRNINLFEQRCKDFHEAEVNTFASMIIQAGERYEGDVALSDDPEHLNSIGLIGLYETVLNRGCMLSIDGLPPVDDPGANNALLFAAGRIADLYMLLGNEAYMDATDPTIGFGTESGVYGTEATSIFCFQNQLPSLLEEELALLRGRFANGTSVEMRPIYNRLIWNYTSGQDGGEVAYSLNYNMKDQNDDGVINEYDARIMFPQGHGDSWGHYLTALKGYYRLLRHPKYTWVPRAESVLVAGMPVEVDYYDERKFTRVAAAKAKCGAEIVNLTYRQNYVEDPLGQWQGYKDDDPDRAWGVSEWACRAGQGAYIDWLVCNAMLPDEDINPEHAGVRKIDRTTVSELRELASCYNEIQATLDSSDGGLNPVGVVADAVPFDISPAEIGQGKTHFEQIYQRAVNALNNAIVVFNHANQQTQLLRRQEDTLEDFQRNVEDREADFNNRLIEIFGTPYPEDCGLGCTYSSDCQYNCPDIYHWMYVDSLIGPTREYEFTMLEYPIDEEGAITKTERKVKFHLSTDLSKLIKPASWKGQRHSPGELQMALSELFQTKARFDEALINYRNLLTQINDQTFLLLNQTLLGLQEIAILNEQKGQMEGFNQAIENQKEWELEHRATASEIINNFNCLAEAMPLVAGLSADYTSAARALAIKGGFWKSKTDNETADELMLSQLASQHAKESLQMETNILLTIGRGAVDFLQRSTQLKQLVRQKAPLSVELYTLRENMQQSERRYLAALAKGERLLEERLRFRQQTAEQIQAYRYKDMAFRIFRNDALQKYRAQFDMAAMYVYLAARAYDFETALLGSHNQAGQAFLTDIIRQRTIGLIEGGLPITGSGLADVMARLSQNFNVLKGQLGFNNPQAETNRFSLRTELFRILSGLDSNDLWRAILEEHRVDNLWDIPEFKRYCRPFAQEGEGKQPGIVIPFETNITSGLNLFGWPLGGGDSYYAPENFATKVRSVGVWLSNYNTLDMTETPRVYLIPVGLDVLRTPYGDSLTTREFQVVDQILPVPFPIGQYGSWTSDREWIPLFDTLSEELAGIRRHSRFLAYQDSGVLDLNQMTYDNRLIGRSVWNTRWLLIIPGASLHGDPKEGIDLFIHGPEIPGGDGARTGYGVTDIKIFFQTYAYSGI